MNVDSLYMTRAVESALDLVAVFLNEQGGPGRTAQCENRQTDWLAMKFDI